MQAYIITFYPNSEVLSVISVSKFYNTNSVIFFIFYATNSQWQVQVARLIV